MNSDSHLRPNSGHSLSDVSKFPPLGMTEVLSKLHKNKIVVWPLSWQEIVFSAVSKFRLLEFNKVNSEHRPQWPHLRLQ